MAAMFPLSPRTYPTDGFGPEKPDLAQRGRTFGGWLTVHAVPEAGVGVGDGDAEAAGSSLAVAWEFPEPPDAQPARANDTRRINALRVMHQGYADPRWMGWSCRVRTLMPRSARSTLPMSDYLSDPSSGFLAVLRKASKLNSAIARAPTTTPKWMAVRSMPRLPPIQRTTADTYAHLLEGVGKAAAEAADSLIVRQPRDHR